MLGVFQTAKDGAYHVRFCSDTQADTFYTGKNFRPKMIQKLP
jgi:hypothetical protein